MSERPAAERAPFQHRYILHLDGLRGLAILLVLVDKIGMDDFHRPVVWGLGALGVTLFFVLSGYLITSVLCAEAARFGRIDIGRFFLRRVLRIFPAYYAFLLVVALLRWLHLVSDVTPLLLFEAATYLRNIFGRGGMTLTHTWSLALEEQFYLLWPWCFRALWPKKLLAYTVGAVTLIALFRTGSASFELFDGTHGQFNMRPWFRFDSPLMGCAVALWLSNRREGTAPMLRPLFVLAVMIPWALFGGEVSAGLYGTLQVLLATLLLVSLHFAPASDPLRWLLSTSPARQLGKLSYSLYLWQQLFVSVKKPEWGWMRVFPIDLVATVAAALVSYRFIERPFLTLKARIDRRSLA